MKRLSLFFIVILFKSPVLASFFLGLYLINRWGRMAQIPHWHILFNGIVVLIGGFCFSRYHITRRLVDKQ